MCKILIIFLALIFLFVFSYSATGEEQGKDLSLKKKDYKMEKKDYQAQIFMVLILVSLAVIFG